MSQRSFHLALGPVQGFVAQARRTRDFWSGSFLLSWLAGVAMLAVRDQGGEVTFPKPNERFLLAMQGHPGDNGDNPPVQGCLPNRFKAIGAIVDHQFDPQRIEGAVREAWQCLADHIWKSDLEPALAGIDPDQVHRTRSIWLRQTENFWEINWTLIEDGSDPDALDRRKNWRNHWPADEPGVGCAMMPGQQELSGLDTPHAVELATFWTALRERLRFAESDLRDGEYLSANAFIKRRFVRHFQNFSVGAGTSDACPPLRGWTLPASVPSVMHLAAAPWLHALVSEASGDQQLMELLSDSLTRVAEIFGLPERASMLPGLERAFRDAGIRPDLAAVDPTCFFSQVIETSHPGAGRELDASQIRYLESGVNMLRHEFACGSPAPFYAVLAMDGDDLGRELRDPGRQSPITAALARFTERVPDLVAEHDGFLVYAGGDDLLALLPITTALRCASALRQAYLEAFHPLAGNDHGSLRVSLSGAVYFAHIRRPLTRVLQDAHELLDQVAKEQTGRDALAVCVHKPGGRHLLWSQPWNQALTENGELHMEKLAEAFRAASDSRATQRFLFKVMALNQRLPQVFSGEEQRQLAIDLIRAELRHSGLSLDRSTNDKGDQDLMEGLVRQAIPTIRHIAPDGATSFTVDDRIKPDAFRLVRFLAQDGRIQ